jgi:hypothetical protein
MLPIIILTLGDMIGHMPQIIKNYRDPKSENIKSLLILSSKFIPRLLSVEKINFVILVSTIGSLLVTILRFTSRMLNYKRDRV